MIFQLRRFDHITDAPASLYWLRVPERIQLKIAVLTYKALHGTALCYLDRLVCVSKLPIGVVSALPAPIACPCRLSNCLLLALEHLMLLLLEQGCDIVTNIARFSQKFENAFVSPILS